MPSVAVDNSPRREPGDSRFIGACRVRHGSSRSYRRATGVRREPHGKDILGGVPLAAMLDATGLASSLARRQDQGAEQVFARSAAVGAGIPAVDLIGSADTT